MIKGNGRCNWSEYWNKKREWDNIGKKLKKNLFETTEHKCVGCGTKENLTVDHIRPLRKDGDNSLENLQILCLDCNRSKGAK